VEIDQEPDLNELLRWTTKIAGRYMGRTKCRSLRKRNAVNSEFLEGTEDDYSRERHSVVI
jgi:hypothetical protein